MLKLIDLKGQGIQENVSKRLEDSNAKLLEIILSPSPKISKEIFTTLARSVLLQQSLITSQIISSSSQRIASFIDLICALEDSDTDSLKELQEPIENLIAISNCFPKIEEISKVSSIFLGFFDVKLKLNAEIWKHVDESLCACLRESVFPQVKTIEKFLREFANKHQIEAERVERVMEEIKRTQERFESAATEVKIEFNGKEKVLFI